MKIKMCLRFTRGSDGFANHYQPTDPLTGIWLEDAVQFNQTPGLLTKDELDQVKALSEYTVIDIDEPPAEVVELKPK